MTSILFNISLILVYLMRPLPETTTKCEVMLLTKIITQSIPILLAIVVMLFKKVIEYLCDRKETNLHHWILCFYYDFDYCQFNLGK